MLHRAAARNIRRHWVRDALRVAVLVSSDLVVVLVIWLAVRALRNGMVLDVPVVGSVSSLFPQGMLGGWRFAVLILVGLLIAGSYGPGDRRRDIARLFKGSALAAFVALFDAAWEQSLYLVSGQFLAATVMVGAAVVAGRTAVDQVLRLVGARVARARVVVVSDGQNDWIELKEAGAGGRVNGSNLVVVSTVISGRGEQRDSRTPLHLLGHVIESRKADTVLVAGPISDADFAYVVDAALVSGCRLLTASRMARTAGVEPRSICFQGLPLVELTAPGLKAWQLAVKRLVDLLGATIGLVVLSPFLLLIAAWVRWDSPGPAVFGQVRLGERGRRFRCRKFRTMRSDAEEVLRADLELQQRYVANNFKLPEAIDPRLTRVGRFLRKTSLDELPQLFNVLVGDMSLVGPRPIVPDEIGHYERSAPLFLSLKPGMTGAWAVSGRSQVGYPDRAHMELEYVRRWSLLSDIGILLCTIPIVLRRQGAH